LTRKFSSNGVYEWDELVTLDINPDHKPSVVHDLMSFPYPFDDNTFDEIHAYEVLEHTGQQGDYKFFFKQWDEFYRILKPKGFFFGTCPTATSVWAWGDPSHTRILSEENLYFLSQNFYNDQVGITAASDFRYIYKSDFDATTVQDEEVDSFKFMLCAVKPSRIESKYA
jgi:cyclopropane fatty-acyl-phospholipid synthase-like methyltransferase